MHNTDICIMHTLTSDSLHKFLHRVSNVVHTRSTHGPVDAADDELDTSGQVTFTEVHLFIYYRKYGFLVSISRVQLVNTVARLDILLCYYRNDNSIEIWSIIELLTSVAYKTQHNS